MFNCKYKILFFLKEEQTNKQKTLEFSKFSKLSESANEEPICPPFFIEITKPSIFGSYMYIL